MSYVWAVLTGEYCPGSWALAYGRGLSLYFGSARARRMPDVCFLVNGHPTYRRALTSIRDRCGLLPNPFPIPGHNSHIHSANHKTEFFSPVNLCYILWADH